MIKKRSFLNSKKMYVVLLLALLILSAMFWQYRRTIKRFIMTEIYSSKNSDNNTCSCTWNSLDLKRDDYKTKHLPGAIISSNNLFIKNRRILNKHINRGKLIEIENNKGYKIRNLNNSSCYLTIDANETLKEMGVRFHNEIKNNREKNSYFELSSVLRTDEQQVEIRKKYPNAATFNNSTHSYGVSFDIAFVKGMSCNSANRALNTVLEEMQKEKKILICPESACIHITVI